VSGTSASPIVVLCGGVGAARFLSGLVAAVDPRRITAIVNTGDDREFYGVHVSPDLDIVTYTLSGQVDSTRGYGLAGDHYSVVDTLGAFGHENWFRLGDRDFALSYHRTLRLAAGAGLTAVTDEIQKHFGAPIRILPMSEDPCPTIVELEGGKRLHFEEYLVRDGAPDEVSGVDLAAAERAAPGPGVLEAISAAGAILLCPSNPVVSIGPILAVPGVRDAVIDSPAPVVAVSPIVGGAPVKGPADRLLRGLGTEVSARGVATWYQGLIDGLIIDQRDAGLAGDIEAMGIPTRVLDTLMTTPEISASVARAALSLAGSLSTAERPR
jgi:LPPG:FO 2-phospho-L-lactate transferase